MAYKGRMVYKECMLSAEDRAFLAAVSKLAFCNPFLPERAAYEREALGPAFEPADTIWSLQPDNPEAERPNISKIAAKLAPLVERLRLATLDGASQALYEDCVIHLLYQRYYESFAKVREGDGNCRFYGAFAADWRHFLPHRQAEAAHIFACFRQVQRAFLHIFESIIGASMPAARLRASVWESIFSYDMRRYRRILFERMGDFATLITGPSGTGKELVARAIAKSRYVPFDANRMTFPSGEPFLPINISALSSTLVESELFGHRRGSFTGAVADRKGWLEACPPYGAVFLDELGDLEQAIQVKLLRVIETRTFHPVGETASKRFQGKLIAATNRDLGAEISAGRFREDLYYRLCSDQIRTPSLREQLDDSPDSLRSLLQFLARRAAGPEAEESLDELEEWIGAKLGAKYGWPGNYRELDQVVRNFLVRRSYTPLMGASRTNEATGLPSGAIQLLGAGITAEELVTIYAASVYGETGSYEGAARVLGLDRRTVKEKVKKYWASRPQPPA